MPNLTDDIVKKLDDISRSTAEISSHTDGTFWHQGAWEVMFDSIAFVASLVAMLAVFTIIYEYRKIRHNQYCQVQVIEEIMRYLYVNDIIIEVLRLKMESRGWNGRPHQAVLRRFNFIDMDLSISNFAVTSKSYHLIHEFQLFLRNYNIMAEVATQHFDNIEEDKRVKVNDLFDLQDRSRRIFARVDVLRKHLGLPIRQVEDVIRSNYRGYFDNTKVVLSDEEKKIVERVVVPSQYAERGIDDHYKKAVANRYKIYYDIEILPLPDEFADHDPFAKDMRDKVYTAEQRRLIP